MTATLLYIAMMGAPDVHNQADFADLPDTGDDCMWVKNRLAEWGVLDDLEFRSVTVTDGDELPPPDDIDAVIVGGSVHSINENKPWQQDVMAWLRRWRSTGRPALGICGGHQMMCVMAGVDVEPLAAGPMDSSAPVEVTAAGQVHPLFDGFGADPWFHFGNYDHAVAVPVGGTVLATTEGSPAVALDHGGNWYSVQFHPEAGHDVFERVWLKVAPENMKNYPPLPEAPRLLVNFLHMGGLV